MNDFFSLTDILVTEERLSVELQQNVPKLGFLSTSSKDSDLKAGMKLEVPFWLASALSKNRSQLISCELPKIYRESYREILQADPCAVDLIKWNQYYYELGLKLRRINMTNVGDEETRRIAEFLLEIFKTRFRNIIDSEQSNVGAKLPVMERELHEKGRTDRQLLLNWMVSAVTTIKASTVTDNLKKRKKMAH